MNPVAGAMAPLIVVSGMLFSNVDVGAVLPNPTLKSIGGEEKTLLSDGEVGAFIFFHPEQEHSLEVLKNLAGLRRETADKPVRWIGVVSDRFSREAMLSALEDAGIELETIIDEGDRLYGELGVRLYPSIGIADGEGTLRAYLPYIKVNYMATVEAHLKHALGELDDRGLEAALNPTSVDFSGNGAVAGRNIRFARMLLKSGKPDKALEKARAAVEAAPGSAEALALVGQILAEQGDCEAARENLLKALEVEPENEAAASALEGCNE